MDETAENTQYQKVKEITDRLEAGIADLFDSDKYRAWLNTMSRFHDYSLNNTLLITMQKPDATYVAGYTSWQKDFGRQVQKGEKAIKILAPTPYKKKMEVDKRDPNTGELLLNADGSSQKEIREVMVPAFKVVNVFDISSTEGKELPTLGVNELDGSVKQYETLFEALKESCPVPVGFEQIDSGAKGYYHLTDQRIAIQEGMSEAQTVKTMIHEMTHQKLHAADPKDMNPEDSKLTRNGKEVEAESVAYTICQHYGIDTSDYSFAYIAGWSRNKDMPELKASMGRIRDAAYEMITEIDGHLEELQKEQTQEKSEGTEVSADGASVNKDRSDDNQGSKEEVSSVREGKTNYVDRELKADEIAGRISGLSEYIDDYEGIDPGDDYGTNAAMVKEDLLEQNESLELTIEGLKEILATNSADEPARAETLEILDEIRDFLGEDSPIVQEHLSGWDSASYRQEPGLQGNGSYRYYSTQRPVDLGTFPKPEGNSPVRLHNYDCDSRIPVEDGKMAAWGWVEYSRPLTEKECRSYELKPALTPGPHLEDRETEKKSVLEDLHSRQSMQECSDKAQKDTAQKIKRTKSKEESL